MSDQSQVDLVVTGMTCASCAARIERKLNKLDGVTAAVNYATGIAHVDFRSGLEVDDLVEAVSAAGYHALPPSPLLDEQVAQIEREHERDLFQRWLLGAVLGAPVVAVAMIDALKFSSWQWAALALAGPVVLWSAWPLHQASFRNARHRATTMDTLVSIGIIAAYLGSLAQLLVALAAGHGADHGPHIYIDIAVVVPVFVLIGRWLEARNKREAGSALRALADATPKSARVRQADGSWLSLPLTEVAVGDLVLVGTESTVPVDGEIEAGTSSVNLALLTGEPLPQTVQVGDSVQAGAVNYDGELQVRVTAVGATSTIARIASLVAAAQSGKANIARLADRVSAIFVPVVFALATVTGLVWMFIDASRALDVVIAVLVIACPCALGLATPTALVVGSGRAARLGFLVSGPQVFEQSRRIDTVVFDKTGTLTTGEMTVIDEDIPAEWRPVLAGLAARSPHPVSVAAAHYFGGSAETAVEGAIAIAGRGVRAESAGRVLEFGATRLHPELELPAVDGTTSWLFVDGVAVGRVTVADSIDPSARDAVRQLQRAGLKVVIASGDQPAAVQKLAAEVGISQVHAGLRPEDKIELVRQLQAGGATVAMVGDGSNDAPALAQADLGIAMGRGTGIARATADITLLRADLGLVPQSLQLSRLTLRVIKQNLGWAFGYNLAAIPLAMTGNLNPMIAGIAMSASSVLVVTNSLRLRRLRLTH